MITTGSNNKPCNCEQPICDVIKDVVVSDVYDCPAIKRGNGYPVQKVIIHRYYDCLVHGPFSARVEVRADRYLYKTTTSYALIPQIDYAPLHCTHTTKGMAQINNRLRELL